MKIRIDKSVFANANDRNKQFELSFLLHIILYKNRYELKIADEDVLYTDSYGQLMQSEREYIEHVIEMDIVTSSNSYDCEVKTGGEAEYTQRVFSTEEAIMYLLQPLSVILENGLNDSHFMNAVFRLFDATGVLTRYVEEGWIRYENAGGCMNVKNFLKARIQQFAGKQKFLRCFVLLDGDRRYPTDGKAEEKYKKLKEQLDAWHVGYHVLEKRCMENYLPDEAMRAVAGTEFKEWFNAYIALTPEQKDFLSIAEGFETDITKEDKKNVRKKESLLTTKVKKRRKKSYVRGFLPHDEQQFYATVSPGNFLHLEKGLKIGNFKVRFPEKFGDTVFTYKANLLQRTIHQSDPQELLHVAQAVAALV